MATTAIRDVPLVPVTELARRRAAVDDDFSY
jgi:hypothetical protein